MPFGRHTEIARAANGDRLRAAEVTVYESGTTTPAALFTDDAGSIPARNPVICDLASGRLTFVAEQGLYDLLYPDGTTLHHVPVVAPAAESGGMEPGDISATPPATWDDETATIGVTPAAYVDPESPTFAEDLVAALQAAGFMEPEPEP